MLEKPQPTHKTPWNSSKVSQSYYNPESFEGSSAATELQNSAYRLYLFCMQTLQSARVNVLVINHNSTLPRSQDTHELVSHSWVCL